jgi:hypothetical protein
MVGIRPKCLGDKASKGLSHMVFERLTFSYNIQKLQDFLLNTVIPIGDPICPIEPGFGGWSITSGNGTWQDGWRESNETVKAPHKYNVPTELCVGYMKEVLEDIKSKGLQPSKVRINNLPPHSKSTIHRDYPSNTFKSRLHIPLLTNEQCCHILYNNNGVEQTRMHMKADGSVYMFWANIKHQYINESTQNRYHIVMDVIDTMKITENFKCTTQ